jgi:hypothetical protein
MAPLLDPSKIAPEKHAPKGGHTYTPRPLSGESTIMDTQPPINVLLAKPVLPTRFSAPIRHAIMNLAIGHSSMTAQTFTRAYGRAQHQPCSGSAR